MIALSNLPTYILLSQYHIVKENTLCYRTDHTYTDLWRKLWRIGLYDSGMVQMTRKCRMYFKDNIVNVNFAVVKRKCDTPQTIA